MSVSFNYFFNSDDTLPVLADKINEVVGCALKPSGGSSEWAFTAFPFFGMELSVSASVSANSEMEGYSDDRDLTFSQYNYGLDVTTYWGQADARPTQLPVLLSIVYLLYQRLGLVGMLVYDVQILLAKYKEEQVREGRAELYDTVSGTTLTLFNDHLNAIRQRLPDAWRLST